MLGAHTQLRTQRGQGKGGGAGREVIKKARVARIKPLWLHCFSDPGKRNNNRGHASSSETQRQSFLSSTLHGGLGDTIT